MKFIRLSTVLDKTALSSTTLYRLMNEGSFPQNVALTDRCVAWVEDEVLEWLGKRLSERDCSQTH